MKPGRVIPFLMILFLGALARAEAPTAAGRIVTVVGEAKVGTRQLAVGDELKVGDRIETGKTASVKVLMPDRTILDISPGSSFIVEEFKPKAGGDRDVTLNIDFGRVRASVNRKLEGSGHIQLRTKSSVLAVRGTEFVVTANKDTNSQQQVVVIDGRVQVSAVGAPAASAVFVTPGKSYVAFAKLDAGAPHWEGQLKPIEMSQVTALATAARAEDVTFLRAIVVQPPENRNERSGARTIEALAPAALQPLGPEAKGRPSNVPPAGVPQANAGTRTGLWTISTGSLPPAPPGPGYLVPLAIKVRIH